jgi:hypothetical protein
MPVPYTFGTATTSIPLSNLDANFNTPVTIGSTTVGLGNTVTTVANLTLTNATISSGNVTVTTGIFGAGSNTAPSITTTGDTNTGIFFPAADTIAFTEGGVESMRIDSSGNVGIGTSSPSYLLNVSKNGGGGDAAQFVRITDTNTSNSVGPLHLTIGAANHFAVSPGMILAGTNGIALAVGDGSNLATQRALTIDSSGNVGIGTSSNSYTAAGRGNLNIAGSSSAILGFQIGGAAKGYYFHNGTDLQMWNEVAGAAVFGTNGLERMRIDSSGYLLVGTTTAPSNSTVTAGSIVSAGSFTTFSGNIGNTTSGTSYNLFTAIAGASYIVNINGANTCSVYLVTCEIASSAVTNTGLLIQNGANVTNSGTTIRFTNNFGGALNNISWSATRLI